MSSKKFLVGLVSLVIASLAFSGYLFFEFKAVPKIVVVDNAVLLLLFNDAIVARSQLTEEKEKWSQNVKVMEDSVKAAFEVLKNGYNSASQQKKAEMEKHLQKWNEEFNRYTRTVEDMSRQKEAEIMKPVLDRLNSYIKIWAKKNNVDAVIGTGNGGVILSANDQINVTDKVLEELNRYYGNKQNVSVKQDTLKSTLSKDSIK